MPRAPVRIDDPSDPRLADYVSVRERDLVGRDGGFIAEGVVVLEKLVAAGRHPIRSVLVAEPRAEALAPLLARLPSEVAVYAAGQSAMDAVVGFHVHRGVLASGVRAGPGRGARRGAGPRGARRGGRGGGAGRGGGGGRGRGAAAGGADAGGRD